MVQEVLDFVRGSQQSEAHRGRRCSFFVAGHKTKACSGFEQAEQISWRVRVAAHQPKYPTCKNLLDALRNGLPSVEGHWFLVQERAAGGLVSSRLGRRSSCQAHFSLWRTSRVYLIGVHLIYGSASHILVYALSHRWLETDKLASWHYSLPGKYSTFEYDYQNLRRCQDANCQYP